VVGAATLVHPTTRVRRTTGRGHQVRESGFLAIIILHLLELVHEPSIVGQHIKNPRGEQPESGQHFRGTAPNLHIPSGLKVNEYCDPLQAFR